jgi:Na+/phosphate symporter
MDAERRILLFFSWLSAPSMLAMKSVQSRDPMEQRELKREMERLEAMETSTWKPNTDRLLNDARPKEMSRQSESAHSPLKSIQNPEKHPRRQNHKSE